MMSVGQALEQLAGKLGAHIIIVEKLNERRVAIDLANRSAMEHLKSILRNCSYAVVFNAPPQVTCMIDQPSESAGSGGPSREGDRSSASADESPAADQRSQLENRIARIEEQISSGEAARFYDHWSQIKDPKYIYNHLDELERMKEKLATLD
jgi:hypothetical protein